MWTHFPQLTYKAVTDQGVRTTVMCSSFFRNYNFKTKQGHGPTGALEKTHSSLHLASRGQQYSLACGHMSLWSHCLLP